VKVGAIRAIWLVFFGAAFGWPVHGQTAGRVPCNFHSGLLATTEVTSTGEVVREINDPQTGRRWLLMRDPSSSGGPGRLVSVQEFSQGAHSSESAPAPLLVCERASTPVIHAGEHVILEENTALVNARLEAVALGPAQNGSQLSVRLVLGGHVVRALALGPGRVGSAYEIGAKP
jgi:hypothetical protein